MENIDFQNNGLSFSRYLGKCFGWMFVGLLLTFLTAMGLAYSGVLLSLYSSMGMGLILICAIVEIILVISVSRNVMNLDSSRAKTMFFIYSIVSGITFGSIFYAFDLSSILYIFLATSAIFAIMAYLGYNTRVDLSKMGTFFLISLIFMLITGVILMFSFNSVVYLIYSFVGIGLFMGLTAYDIQHLKRIYYDVNGEHHDSLAIYGALTLYLDFINLFIHLLSFFGDND